VKQALATLEVKPTDPASNLTVGRFRCFQKGDWDSGLPMLALGSDSTLKALAEKELAEPKSADEQAKLADGWWTAAEKEEGTTRRHIHSQAAHWYRRALPDLTGLDKARAEKRLEEPGPLPEADGRSGDRTPRDAPAISSPRDLLSTQSFAIANPVERQLTYAIRVPKMSTGTGVLEIAVEHMYDDSGDRGMYVKLFDHRRRLVSQKFGNSKGWSLFRRQVPGETDWFVILEDRDAKVATATPGNGGRIRVTIFPGAEK
jgi:hypothetical protein